MIEVRNLTKRYGELTAVDDLTFEVRPNVVTGFLGPNGAGKTTTMRMILGLGTPDSGEVAVNGHRHTRSRAAMREIGALLDARAFHGARRAHDHLLCLATSNGIGRHRVDEVLDMVGLSGVAHRRVGGFSLGMCQRLGIAAALLGDPGVLMLDEPVNGLDPEGILWIRDLLRGLAREGRTVLLSSHLMSEMAMTADHLIVVGRGRLVADAAVDDLVGTDETQPVLVRCANPAVLTDVLTAAGGTVEPGADGALFVTGLPTADVGRFALDAGIALSELAPQRSTLEQAFFELTRDSVDYRVEYSVDHSVQPDAVNGAVR